MRQLLLVIAFILIFGKLLNAVPISLTIYPNVNFTGESITFLQTHTGLECASAFLGNISSVCLSGYWLYGAPIYTMPLVDRTNNRTCTTFSQPERYVSVSSVRRLGPADTSIPAIVFYSGSGVTNYTIISDKIAEANINVVMSLTSSKIITYGSSSWTLFEGVNFVGKSACIDTPNVIRDAYPVNFNLTTVSSVVKGCNLPIDYIKQLRQTL